MKEYDTKRRHPRFEFSEIVHYSQSGADTGKSVCAVSINISESGVCLYTPESINVGDNVFIKTSLKNPHVKATVRWVKKYLDDLYKAGFMFME